MYRVTTIASLLIVLSASSFCSADPVDGDTYFIAPGAGVPKGFQIAGGPFEVSTINGGSESIGLDITGNGNVTSSDELIQNTAINFDFTLRIETDGNFLPEGVIGDSGEELTTLGLFVGGGIDPIEFSQPVFANTAIIEAFDSSGGSLGTINVIDFANFTTGKNGGWDGSLGINFGNAIPIGDVGAIELQVNYNTNSIPEPTSAVVALMGLGLLARRRR
jgi:hypothetical protein